MAGKLKIVEQWLFQKRHYDNTRAVNTINTSPSVFFRHLTRGSEKWFIQVLRVVFHENVPEEVLEMSFLGFLMFWGGGGGCRASHPVLGNMRSGGVSHISSVLSLKFVS